MRKLQITIAAFILLFSIQSNAQVSVSLNIGSRPVLHNNYHDETSYYYYPEIEAYFDMNASVYIYYGPRGWIRSPYLPEHCQNYDINNGYRVAIDYKGNSPFAHFKNHKRKYYRDCHRNYRTEYYRPNYENRREVVAYEDYHRNHNDNDDDNYYKIKNKKGKGRGNGNR
jgi:hypothetical protein